MEACQESNAAPAGPVNNRHMDLTEDLDQQLEDIISTYQEAQLPAEPDDSEEVTAAKEPNARKEQKLEKKMLKNLGGFSFSQNASLILAELGQIQLWNWRALFGEEEHFLRKRWGPRDQQQTGRRIIQQLNS